MAAPLGIALLGCGTVGSAVARALAERSELLAARAGGPLELRRVVVRDTGRKREADLGDADVGDDARAAALAGDVDIVVEVMGGLDPAHEAIGAALDAGRAVVTANKALIAAHGPELVRRVQAASGGLRFEAAVCAGIPVVATLRESLCGDRVTGLTGVVNGTTNFMLERMAAGDTYAAALVTAQQLGYAEADPAADVAGHDAAQKLAILAWIALGAAVTEADVIRRGIDTLRDDDIAVAAELGGMVRLIAHAMRGETPEAVTLAVQPTIVPRWHTLYALPAAENAVVLEADLAGEIELRGHGAGGDATASAVISDIVAAARARRQGCDAPDLPAERIRVQDAETAETMAVLRVAVGDDPEAAEVVAQMLEDRGVPVEELRYRDGDAGREVLALTGSAPRAGIERAAETLETVPAVREVLSRLDRIEAPR